MKVDASQIVFGAGVACGLLGAALVHALLPADKEPDLGHYAEVREFVQDSFVRQLSDQELLEMALHGMLSGLDDYSRYYDSSEAAALNRETAGRYVGIGAVFRAPTGDAQVLFTLEDSPAERAGVRVGDTFVTVAGEEVATMPPGRLRELLGDPSRTQLEVEAVGLDGERRELSIALESLIDPTVRHERLVDGEQGVGYLAISSFTHETVEEFDAAFERLEADGMRALVLDLRGNRGGVLGAAVEIARRFVEHGVIVSTEGRGEPVVYASEPGSARHLGFPLVVLVDGTSASASEVLAAALQDHRAAVIAGSPTYGKGMVQTIRRFAEEGTIAKVTSSYYYTPAGRNLERSVDPGRTHGIRPDVEIELEDDSERAIREYLGRYSPPPSARPLIAEWEDREAEELIPRHPRDPHLECALALFRGEHPGPRPIR